MEFEIKSILKIQIQKIKKQIKELGKVSEMSEKELKLYYIYSGQVSVLEKVNRDISKCFRELKKIPSSLQTNGTL